MTRPLRLLLVLTMLATLVPAVVAPSAASAETTTVSGTVFDATTGAVIPNISVRVYGSDIDYDVDQVTVTDGAGAWSVSDVPVGAWLDVMAFDPAGDHYGFRVQMVSVGSGGETVDHYLSEGTMVSGTVTNSAEEPVAGVEVTTWTGPAPVTTDTAGDFAFDYPFPSGYRMLSYEPPADSGLLRAEEEYELVAGSPTVLGVVLFAPSSMSGTVTAAEGGAGIDEIEVTLYDTSPDCSWACDYSTSTNHDGTWSITDLPQGEYIVLFEDWWRDTFAREYYNGVVRESEATAVPVAEAEAVTGIDATLDTATTISGTVMAHGSPVTDAYLRLFEGGTTAEHEVDQSETCCGDNTFEFWGLRPGTYYLLAEIGNSIQHWHGPTGQAVDAVEITPTSQTPVEGLTVEIQDVAVIDATVQFDGQPLADLSLDYQDDTYSYFASQATDATGSATLVVPPGPGTLTSSAPFHTTESVVVDLTAGQVRRPELTATSTHLGTVGNPSGVVVDPSTDTDGVPTVEAGTAVTITLDACPGAWYAYVDLDPRAGGEWLSADMSESDGTYQASFPDGVSPGLYDGTAWIECDGETSEEVAFGLYAPSQLQVVDRAGTPVAGVEATLFDAWTGDPIATPTAHLAPITPDPVQTTDADGMFGWLLDFWARDYGLVLTDGACTMTYEWLYGEELGSNTFEFDCGPLPQDAPGIWGVVQDASTGDPLAGIDVQLRAWDDPSVVVTTVTTGDDGVYAFGDEHVDLSSDYEIEAFDPADQFGFASGYVYVDGDPMVQRRDLSMTNEVTFVSGTVESMAGPVEGAEVSGLGPVVHTDEFGDYRSVALPRDRYFYFNVAPPDGSDLLRESGQVITTGAEMTVDVYLETPGAISGTVTDGADNPLAGIIVSSASFGQILTDAAGNYHAPGLYPGSDVTVQFYDETGTYAYEWWDDQPTEAAADPITVAEGQTTPDINAVLGVGSSIVGTITAVGGAPIPDQHVALFDSGGNSITATRTDEAGNYAFSGVPVGSYTVGYEGVGGPWYPGDTDDQSAATPTEVTTSGTEVVEDLEVPGVGFVGGVVRQNDQPVVGAWVSAEGSWWDSGPSGDGGVYLLVAAVGTVDVSAYADMWSDEVVHSGLSIAEGEVTMQDFDLTSQLPGSTQPPPAGTTVTGSRTTSGGLPTLGPSDPVTVTTTGCPGGTASFDIVEVYPGSGTSVADVAMTEGPDGTYVGTAPAQTPGTVYEVRITIDCPGDTPDESTEFGLYIDPEGTIVDTEGDPIQGATATLYRSEDEGGPYTIVPDGSVIMSPENRTNPDITGEDGRFQWLTQPGWYKVRAEKEGCTDPDSDATFVETEELPVPPEQVGLVLVLDCGEGEVPGEPDTSITTGPTGTVATTTATLGFSSDDAGATFDCRLDGGPWASCASPKQYTGLSQGKHTFEVRASAGGLTDATPASRTWTVDTAAPNTTITSGPSGTTTSQSASFAFSSSEAGATFQCRLDGGSWTSCASPRSYSSLKEGSHTFQVRARDGVGTTDASPASRTWSVDLPAEPAPTGPTPEFTDDDNSIFERDIEKLAASGITKGCNPPSNDKFCPTDEVSRGAMAAFLVRAKEYPAAPLGRFDDARGHLFEADIAALARAGVTKGCNPPANDMFCPDDDVTRGEMAAFLVRALNLPRAPVGRFDDARGHLFEADIAALAKAGITKGCNPPANDMFCPDDYVERGEMAAFLVRAGLTD